MKNYLEVGAVRLRIRRDPLSAKWGWPLLSIGGLEFISQTNSKSLYNIASYHDPRSLTWSWILSVWFRRSRKAFFHKHRRMGNGSNRLNWHLGLYFLEFQFQQQDKMIREKPSNGS